MRLVVIAVIVGGLATDAIAQPAPDRERARELYKSAEAAMAAQDYETAVRDYGAAYELSKDPVLFYKIGTANERAGKCPVAVIYYRRYLSQAKPTPAFVDITNARIKACEPDQPAVGDKPAVDKPSDKPVDKPLEKPAPVTPPTEVPTAEPAKEDPKTSMGGFVGSRDNAAGDKTALTSRHRGAWLFVTGSVALITIGAVLAYSADSAENDINDLYVGLSGNPPVFDRETKALYDEMVAEGERYEKLSWAALGLAGVTGGIAAILFYREHRRTKDAKSVTVTPTATANGAGVRAVITF